MTLITGVVVNYRTPDLLLKAIQSIRKFYDFKIIVINGSHITLGETCMGMKNLCDYPNIQIEELGYNIGHGLGMDKGIKMADTKYVLTFDTDIEMKEPCLEDMLEKIGDNYAIGKVYDISMKGGFYKENADLFVKANSVRMVHPSFQIVNKEQYLKYAPYISDGAPTVLSYHDLARRGLESLMIDYPVLDYVYHRNAGTRDVVKEDTDYRKNTHWAYKWEKWIKENPID